MEKILAETVSKKLDSFSRESYDFSCISSIPNGAKPSSFPTIFSLTQALPGPLNGVERIKTMKKPSLLLMLFGEIRRRLISSFQVLGFLLFGAKEKVSSMDIYGDQAFCGAVKRALLFLKGKDLSLFNLMDQHLDLIIQSADTLLDPNRFGVALALDMKDAKEVSQEWLACYGYRAKLYQDYVNQHGYSFKVPKSAYYGAEGWDFMYQCLQKLGGSYEEIQHLSEFIEEERKKLKMESG